MLSLSTIPISVNSKYEIIRLDYQTVVFITHAVGTGNPLNLDGPLNLNAVGTDIRREGKARHPRELVHRFRQPCPSWPLIPFMQVANTRPWFFVVRLAASKQRYCTVLCLLNLSTRCSVFFLSVCGARVAAVRQKNWHSIRRLLRSHRHCKMLCEQVVKSGCLSNSGQHPLLEWGKGTAQRSLSFCPPSRGRG